MLPNENATDGHNETETTMKHYKVFKANGELFETFETRNEAYDFLEYGASMEFSEDGYYLEEVLICRCGSEEDVDERCDAYGFYTGDWCDSCYNSDKYPYRKDRYHDFLDAGEHLE